MEASCLGLDPAMFFPEDPEKWAEAAQVKAMCAACPVRTQCIDYSVTSPYQEEGYWGISQTDRERLRKTYKHNMDDFTDAIDVVASDLLKMDEVIL